MNLSTRLWPKVTSYNQRWSLFSQVSQVRLHLTKSRQIKYKTNLNCCRNLEWIIVDSCLVFFTCEKWKCEKKFSKFRNPQDTIFSVFLDGWTNSWYHQANKSHLIKSKKLTTILQYYIIPTQVQFLIINKV